MGWDGILTCADISNRLATFKRSTARILRHSLA